jgi:hypothetical protein
VRIISLRSCCSSCGKLSRILRKFHGSSSPRGVPGDSDAGASDGGGFDMLPQLEGGVVEVALFNNACKDCGVAGAPPGGCNSVAAGTLAVVAKGCCGRVLCRAKRANAEKRFKRCGICPLGVRGEQSAETPSRCANIQYFSSELAKSTRYGACSRKSRQGQLVERVDGAHKLAKIHQPVAVGVKARDCGGGICFRIRHDGFFSVSQRLRQCCDR